MLRDRILCGVRDKHIKCTLLAQQQDLTFDSALKIARAMEAADKDAKDLQHPAASDNPVHFVRQQNPTHRKNTRDSTPSACYRCGGKHLSAACKFKSATCHYCHKQGRIASVCHSKARDAKKKKQTPTAHPTHQVQEDAGNCPKYMYYLAA